MRKGFLYLYVFCTGAAVLALEISASRLLAPFFGTSLFVWGNIIGIVLGALAAGYYFGGKLADRSPSPETLGLVTWTGGMLTCAIPLFSPFILRSVTEALFGLPLFLIASSFVSMLFLFALPLCLLGALSPMAARLGTRRIEEVGTVSGALSASATAGSLFGAFIPSFVTIPFFGTRATILGAGLSMILLGGALIKKRAYFLGLLAPLALLLAGSAGAASFGRVVYEKESPYQYIRVVESGGRRMLLTNEGLGVQTISEMPDGLTGVYSDSVAATPYLLDGKKPIRALIIGVAGGVSIRQFRRFAPPEGIASIDAVDIDPEMPKIARAYFGLAPGAATIHVADGRAFLSQSRDTYDLVFIDAFRDELYVPFHLATAEFFRMVRSRLAPGGVVAVNVIGAGEDDPLVARFASTVRSAFEDARIAETSDGNFLILGSEAPIAKERLSSAPEPLTSVAANLAASLHAVAPGGKILTDDLAPVEYLTDRFMWDSVKRFSASASTRS